MCSKCYFFLTCFFDLYVSYVLSVPALPLLSVKSIAAGVAGGLSSSISSPAVYVVAARLLKAPVPPAHACNRGLCVDGLGSVLSGLMGAPVGLCSSVPNACVIGLSQVRDCIDAFTKVL